MRNRRQSFSMLTKEASNFEEEHRNDNGRRQGKPNKKVEYQRPEESKRGLAYIIDDLGKDAKFISGVHSGKMVSELVQTVEGRDYLGSVWKIGRRDLQSVIRQYFSD